jgi:Ca2+/Na+ antiporter
MALTIFQNPRNWSTLTKFFVTFELCLLTVSVYIGSAIYTAGIPDIMKSFEVSQVEATLGLTIFVIGYALGTSIYSLMAPATVILASTCYHAFIRGRRVIITMKHHLWISHLPSSLRRLYNVLTWPS